MLFTDTQQLSSKAFDALRRIKTSKIEESNTTSNKTSKIAKKKYNLVINEFDKDKFITKTKFDSYIYETLLEGFNDNQKENIATIVNDIENTIKQIYEFLNIEPRIVGFKNMDVNDSESKLLTEAKSIVNTFVNKEYYSLTNQERTVKYKPAAVQMAYDLVVQENLDPNEAIEHSYKSLVIENLIDNIHFPFIIKHKLNEVFEDELYNEFFDVTELHELHDNYIEKRNQLARLVATVI